MPSIAKINKQLETVNENLEKWLPKLNCPVISIDSNVADIIEKLARTQKILIETQIAYLLRLRNLIWI